MAGTSPEGMSDASMKGFPRRGSNRPRILHPVVANLASMKGFPRRGSNRPRILHPVVANLASMKGFPRRGSNPPRWRWTEARASPQ